MTILGVVTNLGVLKIREAQNDEGFKIFPQTFAVSRTQGPLDPNRTTANSGVWYQAPISSRIPEGTNSVKCICTVPVDRIPSGTTENIREIYIFCKDSNNNDFIFSIGHPSNDIIYDPSSSITLELQISITNADLTSVIVFNNTLATELAEHNTDPNAHSEIIAAMNKAGQFLLSGGHPFQYAGQTFDEKSEFDGTKSTKTIDSVVFVARKRGILGNQIFLVFDGVKTVDQVIIAWNAANPNNEVTHNGSGQEIFTAQSILLTGGTSLVDYGDLVYLDTDKIYRKAIADGTHKAQVIGIADTIQGIVRTAGFFSFASGFPVGSSLFLSTTNSGKMTTISSPVKIAIVHTPQTIMFSSFGGGGGGINGLEYDALVSDNAGDKKYPTTQEAINNVPTNGRILIAKMEQIKSQIDCLGKRIVFDFVAPWCGWTRFLGLHHRNHITFDLVPTSGFWRIEYEGLETIELAHNASALSIETAFNAIASSPVVVSGDYSLGFDLVYSDFLTHPAPSFSFEGANEIQRIDFSETPDDGTFRLTLDGQTTVNIPYNANLTTIRTWISNLSNVDDIAISGGLDLKYLIIEFVGTDSKTPKPEFTLDYNSLKKLGATVDVVISTTQQGKTPSNMLIASGFPVAVSANIVEIGENVGPTKLIEVGSDSTRFGGYGTVSGFAIAIDMHGKKNVDVELNFENCEHPVIDSASSLSVNRAHRAKSFGFDDRNVLVVSNSGDFKTFVEALASAQTGDVIVVVNDQEITSPLVIDKDVEIICKNGSKFHIAYPMLEPLAFFGMCRTKHLHILIDQVGFYDNIVVVRGFGSHHQDLFIDIVGTNIEISRAFAIEMTANSIYIDGLISYGNISVSRVLANNSNMYNHNVVIRDKKRGTTFDTFVDYQNLDVEDIYKEVPVGAIDGSNKTFELTHKPISSAHTNVYLDGDYIESIHWHIADDTKIVFNSYAPVVGQTLEAWYMSARTEIALTGGLIRETPSGLVDGTNKDFVLESKPIDENFVALFINGRFLSMNEWSVDKPTQTVTLVDAPVVGQQLEVWYCTATNGSSFRREIPSGLVDGSNTLFVLADSPFSKNFLGIFINGIKLDSSEWSLAGKNISLNVAPVVGQSIDCYYSENENDFFKQEFPSGNINGSNQVFEVLDAPYDFNYISIFVDGLWVDTARFSMLSAKQFRLLDTPQIGQVVECWYTPNRIGSGVTPPNPDGGTINWEDLEAIPVDIQPDTNGGRSLGTSTKAWQDLYLRDKVTGQTWCCQIADGSFEVVLASGQVGWEALFMTDKTTSVNYRLEVENGIFQVVLV